MEGKVYAIPNVPTPNVPVKVDPDKSAADEWKVKDSQSTVYAQGLGGSITGKGGNLIIVDDYCKNREEAESKAILQSFFRERRM